MTTRERLEKHRTDPACANCHALMDPYGMTFENYDAIGRYRDQRRAQAGGRQRARAAGRDRRRQGRASS